MAFTTTLMNNKKEGKTRYSYTQNVWECLHCYSSNNEPTYVTSNDFSSHMRDTHPKIKSDLTINGVFKSTEGKDFKKTEWTVLKYRLKTEK